MGQGTGETGVRWDRAGYCKKNSRVTKEGKPVIKSQTRKLFDFQSPNIRDGATASTKALGPTHFNPLADGRIKMGKQLFVELKLPRNQTKFHFYSSSVYKCIPKHVFENFRLNVHSKVYI